MKITPVVNQIRLCPGDIKEQIIKKSRKHNILIEAYSTLDGSDQKSILKDDLLIDLGQKYNKSPTQICLHWTIQQKYLPLPRSISKEHIKANYVVYDLEKEEVEKLNNLCGYPDPFLHPDHITW